MKLTADDIPCLVQSKYVELPKKRVLDLTTPEDVNDLFETDADNYEEILIGGGNVSSKIEFNIARCKYVVDMEFTNMPDGDFYFQKYKSKDGNTMYRLVKIYDIITRIPRAPNCVEALMQYSVDELLIDTTRLKLNAGKKTHKWLAYEIINWYFDFTYERLNMDTDYIYNDESIELYPNLIAEIQGRD